MTEDEQKQLGNIAFWSGCAVLFGLTVLAIASLWAFAVALSIGDWFVVALSGVLFAMFASGIAHVLRRL